MNVEIFRDALLSKRGELLGGNARPSRCSGRWRTTPGARATWPIRLAGNNEVHIQLKLKQTDAKILQAIEGALRRIEEGTYGVCRDCGEPIAEARLTAIPWTRSCISCKEKQNA